MLHTAAFTRYVSSNIRPIFAGMLPEKLLHKLALRAQAGNLRALQVVSGLVDFSSNDYLGLSKTLMVEPASRHGATGSRLITGNSELHLDLEKQIAAFHNAPAALLFNSGYDANLGVIPALTDRTDVILYDEFVHASIRDGISLSHAKAIKFKHNDLTHLEKLLNKASLTCIGALYVITESVFSMDGDMPDLSALVRLVKKHNKAHIILDEAHALGVVGKNGAGLAQHVGVEERILVRIVTFGKALGSHGAAVLGTEELKKYLINFARSFIYTTALPEYALYSIRAGYEVLAGNNSPVALLQQRINEYHKIVKELEFVAHDHAGGVRFRESEQLINPFMTAIQTVIIPNNDRVKTLAQNMQRGGYDLRAIVAPTVPMGQERLRICLHAFNSYEDLENMLILLKKELNSHG